MRTHKKDWIGARGDVMEHPANVAKRESASADIMVDLSPDASLDGLTSAIEQTMEAARGSAVRQVNVTQLLAYWNIGRLIVEYEQCGCDRARYGDQTLLHLSRKLSPVLGRGFSRSNLYNMRQLYLTHRTVQTLSGKLTWSHYCELLSVTDTEKRLFYEREAENSGWSVRELRRQMDSMLFERILGAKQDAQREDIMRLAREGVAYSRPSDVVRDPYVLEFLDLPDETVSGEGDLERAIVSQIEKFMLELGRGFMFVGTQQRVPVGTEHDQVDMVFYNKPLRAYVLIELKTTKLMASAVGQINEHLNYYAAEVNDEIDNPPIGIILCTDKNNVRAEYALGGRSNAILASTYTLRLPDVEQLEEQVRRTIETNERRMLGAGA